MMAKDLMRVHLPIGHPEEPFENLERIGEADIPGYGIAIFSQCCPGHIHIELNGVELAVDLATVFEGMAAVLNAKLDEMEQAKRKVH